MSRTERPSSSDGTSSKTAQPARKRVNLALQGGGAHGAFTWGVLDALLEDGRLEFEGISGASSGSVNAVALVDGLLRGDAEVDSYEAARAKLRNVWKGVMAAGSLTALNDNLASMVPFLSMLPNPGSILANAFQQFSSPYNFNPLDLNPLRELLRREVDFDALARMRRHRLFLSATHISSGKAEVFTGKEISLQAVMASSCLPQAFQAVELNGHNYWDGGFVANPPLTPLISKCESADILLVQIAPLKREGVPTSQTDITDRINEITFNANLLSQMHTIGFVNRLIDEGKLQEPEFKRVLMHRIDGGEMMSGLDSYSKISTDTTLLNRLFEHGRAQAQAWLKKAYPLVGRKSSINIDRDYSDDMVMHD